MNDTHCKRAFALVLSVVVLSMLLAPAFASGNDLRDAVDKGIGLYEKGDFSAAIQHLKDVVTEWKDRAQGESGKESLFSAHLYLGISHLGMGKEAAAREAFKQAFRIAPKKTLSADQFSPKVVALYEEVVAQGLSGLTVKVNVPNAEIYLDDVKKGRAPLVLHNLLPGSHTVRVVAAGQESMRTVELQPESDTTVMFDFKASGQIAVSSSPVGASVFFNGRLMGMTPFQIKDVPAGEHLIRLAREGYLEANQKVLVKENEIATVSVSLEAVAHTVRITSVPDGAEVRWNDAPRGKTPLTIENVTPGTYRIEIAREGYEELRDVLEVKTPLTVKEYRLNFLSGGMSVKTEPAGAEVYIDNKLAGTTPLTVSALSVKQYVLRLKKDGYREKSLNVLIARDRVAEVHETLLVTDTLPPEIAFQPLPKAVKENRNAIAARVIDNQGVGEVTLLLRMQGEQSFQSIRMTSTIKSVYEGIIPDLYMKKGAVLEYYLTACDLQNNCASSRGKDNPYTVKVVSLEPYTEGFILDADNDKGRVTISLGALDGVKKQDRYVVFRAGKELRDPKSGELLQIEEVLVGVLRIRELMPRTSYAEIDDSSIPVMKDDRIRKQVSAPAEVVNDGSYPAKIVLRWAPNREPEVKGYRIFRSQRSDGIFNRIGEVEGRDNTVFEDSEGMMEGLAFFYRISAFNRFGTDGLLSEPTIGKTKSGVAPPAELRTESSKYREIAVKWSLLGQDRDIETYLVYRSEDSSGPYAEIGRTDRDAAAFTDRDNLKDGRTYFYRVAGKSRYGSIGEKSAAIAGKAKEGPPAPREIRAVGLPRGVKLTWNKHEDPSVDGYIVYRNERESGTFTEIGKTSRLEFEDDDVPEGKAFYYIVASYISARGSDIVGPASKSISGSLKKKPSAPQGLTAEGRPGNILLKWSRNPEGDIAEYWIYRGTGETPGSRPHLKVSGAILQAADEDVSESKRYFYAIRAVDSAGLQSELSPVVNAALPQKAAP